MQKNCTHTVFFYFLLLLIALYPLKNHAQPGDDLKSKVARNKELFRTNIDEAFNETDVLLKEATHLNDEVALTALLENRCKYYYSRQQLGPLASEAKQLYDAAVSVKDSYRQLMANIYLAEAYAINGLYGKAIRHLNENLEMTKNADPSDARLFFGRINTLTSFANLYNDEGEHKKAVHTIRGIIKNYDLLKNPQDIRKYQYVNYSNLAGTYYHFNLDSANYFARKSIEIEPEQGAGPVRVSNLLILGKIAKEKGSYEEALEYLREAEKLSAETGEKLNIEEIYSNLTEVYGIQKKENERLKTENKLKDVKMEHLNSKNESLYKMVSEQSGFDDKLIYYLSAFSLIILLFVFWYRQRATRTNAPEQLPLYDELIEMIKKDDPAYMPAFEKAYPEFSKKLLEIDPALSSSEIEFCSLLKLNLSTKKIAQVKFIEVRTVQNKKYRIRKKLHIPAETDLYNWFAICI